MASVATGLPAASRRYVAIAICCSVASSVGIAALMLRASSPTETFSPSLLSRVVAIVRLPPVLMPRRCGWINAYDILLARYEFHDFRCDRHERGSSLLPGSGRSDPAEDPGAAR